MTVIAQLRSVWSATKDLSRSGTASDGEYGDPEPRSALFHCPECENVYIATEKEHCRGCGEEVREVRGWAE